jgi:hypothetical protein
MDYGAPRRVRLTCDLTRYDERCVAGSMGTTTKANSGWAALDAFAAVQFDSGAYLPVAWSGLEIIEAVKK